MTRTCVGCGGTVNANEAFCGSCGRPQGASPTKGAPPAGGTSTFGSTGLPPLGHPGPGVATPNLPPPPNAPAGRRDTVLWVVSGALAAVAVVGLLVAFIAMRGGDDDPIVAPGAETTDPSDPSDTTDPSDPSDTTAPSDTVPETAPETVPITAAPAPTTIPTPSTVVPVVPVVTTTPPPVTVPVTAAPRPPAVTTPPVVTPATIACQRQVDFSTTHLKYGDCGPSVTSLQQLLQCVGYSVGADGVFGAATRDSVSAFQSFAGLTQDGQAGPATRTSLDSYC